MTICRQCSLPHTKEETRALCGVLERAEGLKWLEHVGATHLRASRVGCNFAAGALL